MLYRVFTWIYKVYVDLYKVVQGKKGLYGLVQGYIGFLGVIQGYIGSYRGYTVYLWSQVSGPSGEGAVCAFFEASQAEHGLRVLDVAPFRVQVWGFATS